MQYQQSRPHYPPYQGSTVPLTAWVPPTPVNADLGLAGVVVIGRNEGVRLRHCFESLRNLQQRTVYVDSGSTDESVRIAGEYGLSVVELARSQPFTAARARNEGCQKLLATHAGLRYVFFVDGDCEVAPGWLNAAVGFLEQNLDVAVVWGRRRERHPEKSVYNLLCDLEWQDASIGETAVCGGDIVIRTAALSEVGGYRGDLICGEEPELCVRLRQANWRIWRLGEEMTIHDAALYRFGQWWKRMVRGGYAFAQGASIHGARPERLWVAESRRSLVWGVGIPAATILLGALLGPAALLLLLLYPLQVVRLALLGKRSPRENWYRAGALVLSKFPEALGQFKFYLDRKRRARRALIEYK